MFFKLSKFFLGKEDNIYFTQWIFPVDADYRTVDVGLANDIKLLECMVIVSMLKGNE